MHEYRPPHVTMTGAGIEMTKTPMPDTTVSASTSGRGAEQGDKRPLPPAAERALAEAEARRAAARSEEAARPKEFQGPKGPEPTRFGDWEKNGIASDF